MRIENIPLDQITYPTEMHRKAHDPIALERLAASIRDVGLMNPITVEAAGDHYVLRAGDRRLQAHRLLRRETIPANIRTGGELAHGEVLTWTENLEREDLSPIEQAEACARMKATGSLSVAAIARMLKRTEAWVDERLDLLEIPPALQQLVHTRELPMRHAIELARVADEQHRDYLTRYALLSGASYTVIKDWVAQWRMHHEANAEGFAPLPPLPQNGERAIVLIPCMTCGDPHPPHELRIAHICTGCHATVMDATSEWRKPLTSNARSSEAQEPHS